MTKNEFKEYITQAIDAMQDGELEYLFPNAGQPDLFTLSKELTGLKGEMKKLSGASLRLNQDIRDLLELSQAASLENGQRSPEDLEKENKELKDNLKYLMQQLIEQDDFISRTAKHLETLPSPGLLSLSNYKTSMAAWEKGFEITVDKWQNFIKSLGLYKTGLPGESFDPATHEAVAVKYDSNQPENSVLESEVTGFLYRQNIIRQAKVVVNKRPAPKPTIEAEPVLLPPITPDLQTTPAPPPGPAATHETEIKANKNDKRKRRKSRKNKRRKR